MFSYLRTLTTWHCPHSPAANCCCSDRYLLSAGPTAAGLCLKEDDYYWANPTNTACPLKRSVLVGLLPELTSTRVNKPRFAWFFMLQNVACDICDLSRIFRNRSINWRKTGKTNWKWNGIMHVALVVNNAHTHACTRAPRHTAPAGQNTPNSSPLIFCQILTDFQNSFTERFSRKFAVNKLRYVVKYLILSIAMCKKRVKRLANWHVSRIWCQVNMLKSVYTSLLIIQVMLNFVWQLLTTAVSRQTSGEFFVF